MSSYDLPFHGSSPLVHSQASSMQREKPLLEGCYYKHAIDDPQIQQIEEVNCVAVNSVAVDSVAVNGENGQ